MRPLQTDFHTHLVPRVDDGARSAAETVAMARGLYALGVRRVHLTPHQFRFGNNFSVSELHEQAVAVRALLQRANLPLEIRGGAEYLCRAPFFDAVHRGDTLATFEFGRERCVLVEFPPAQPLFGAQKLCETLLERGIRPMMAHPERADPRVVGRERLDELLAAGWIFQLNLLSLVGRHGPSAQVRAHALVERGDVAAVGSDLHRPSELDALRRAHERFQRLRAVEVTR